LAQSLSLLQVPLQVLVLAQVSPPVQARGVPALHRATPSQAPPGVKVEPLQVAVPHAVPEAGIRHAPAPLQKPSRPHGLVASDAHSLSGSLPVGTAAHLPFA
jgi:hypothetical protein